VNSKISAKFYLSFPGFVLDVDCEIAASGVTAVFGRSGSGKTSFLRCFAGLETTSTGRLVVFDECWQHEKQFMPTYKRPIGFVFQDAGLFSHLNVRKNLQFSQRRADKKNAKISFDKVVAICDIAQLLTRGTDTLSGGEKQRVAIARSLLINPKVLLMDEPLASLDQEGKNTILPFIEALKTELSMPILYVSHSISEVARLADEVIFLEHGKITAQGSVSDTLGILSESSTAIDEASVVIEAKVCEKNHQWNLVRAVFDGGSLWLRDNNYGIAQKLRLHVLAKDVSITLSHHDDSSILNIMAATVETIFDDQICQGSMLVSLKVGRSIFLARITHRSLSVLALRINQVVFLQIKSVAISY